ncbi:MAG: NADH-quinone oxidoreductase subunit NuoG [Rhodospirillales bacterium]|jgi:NADH-quinone oxidoreductase subunit G|nr:NADH-quinone oxidoreductase subunit NuoG [Rhodospirillales bacterium]MDP6643505.1 NADH-quinone oxidoreductase subunit NuoG [Rhodospirillales bacterium]
MPKITIDDIELEVEPGLTVLQACELAGKEIPRFCFHERLSVAGNCRMCLVEMERAPKPIASCAMPVGDGMVIRTDTEMVRKARRGVMEFLLINHPLDCPICDQGGECDLQDQAMGYGYDRSRFAENKRAVDDKYIGPLIKTVMTRCIHCTRCVRFAAEVAGVPELGATGRGENTEIGTYLEKALTSELSGNMIDLCPVGALTSKPYAFSARSWELKKTESIDVMDAVGTNIRVDARGPEVMRILPRNNDDVNEEWLSDKGRFANDGLGRQRLDRPYLRIDGKLAPVDWDRAFEAIAARLNGTAGNKIAAIAGDLADCEAMAALKDLIAGLGSANIDCRQDGAPIGEGARAGYLFNTTIAGIDQADAILIIGSNPRSEAPVLNARIRKRYLDGGVKIGLIGEPADLTYKYEYLGAGTDAVAAIQDGANPFAGILRAAERPMIILGSAAVARADGAAILAAARQIAEDSGAVSSDWNGFNMLHGAAARVGGIELGFLPGDGGLATRAILDGAASGAIEVVYLLGADEIDTDALGDAFVIYQGHHGDAGAHRADVILPGAAYTEKNATYVNTEGRVQRAALAVFPPGDAREDWAIIRALSAVLGKTLAYDSLNDLRAKMETANPIFAVVDEITPAEWGEFGSAGDMSGEEFRSPIENYYMTDPISRASATMSRCVGEILGSEQPKTGTDG